MLGELVLGLFLTPPAYLFGWGSVRAGRRLWRCGVLGFWMTEAGRQRRAERRQQELPDLLLAVAKHAARLSAEHARLAAKHASLVEFGVAPDRRKFNKRY